MDPHEYLTIEDLDALTDDWLALVDEADEGSADEEASETVVVSGGYAELFADGSVVAHGLVMGNVSDYLEHGARFDPDCFNPDWYDADRDEE